jgi:hypothetical protein
MIGLQRFANNPKIYDKSTAYSGGTRFRCSDTISDISKISHLINVNEAMDPDVVRAIMASRDDTSRKYLEKFLEKKPRIEYKKAKEACAVEK